MKFNNYIRNIMSHLKSLLNNTVTAEKRIGDLRNELERIKKANIEEGIQLLVRENKYLKAEVEKARNNVIKFEQSKGIKQYEIPGRPLTQAEVKKEHNAPIEHKTQKGAESAAKNEVSKGDIIANQKLTKQVKKDKQPNEKKKEKATTVNANVETIVDVRKLDFRIGKIVDINKHPDADTLYVEKIDCGEDNPRTVVSGLVNHVPIEEMRNRIVMVLCNLKPVKMRGITSEAMVMCASSPDKVEVLIPPKGADPGDLVTCKGYPREPEPQLNPKKKIFETCAPDLKTDDNGIACYMGSPLEVDGKGPVISSTLKGVSVK